MISRGLGILVLERNTWVGVLPTQIVASDMVIGTQD